MQHLRKTHPTSTKLKRGCQVGWLRQKKCASTLFPQIWKKQLIELQDRLERNFLPVFGFNSPHNDLILIKSCLLPFSVSERDIETTVIKKAIQFIWSNFCDNQLLDIMKFLSVATSLDSFLKAYKISETKELFPYEEIDQPDKTQKTEHSPMRHNIQDAFYSKLRSCNSHEAEHTDYANLLKSGLTTEPAAFKLKSSKPPPFGIENCHVVQQTLKQEQMSSFKNLLRWYSSKDVLPILEATQKRLPFTTTKISKY